MKTKKYNLKDTVITVSSFKSVSLRNDKVIVKGCRKQYEKFN